MGGHPPTPCLPLYLVMDKIAPPTHQDPLLCAASVSFTYNLCSTPVQKVTHLKTYKHSLIRPLRDGDISIFFFNIIFIWFTTRGREAEDLKQSHFAPLCWWLKGWAEKCLDLLWRSPFHWVHLHAACIMRDPIRLAPGLFDPSPSGRRLQIMASF